MTVKRHQLSRKIGYRKPLGVKVVTRPGKWGNPYATAEQFRQVFTELRDALKTGKDLNSIDSDRKRVLWMVEHIEQLRGKDLACWCGADADCHADALIDFANQ